MTQTLQQALLKAGLVSKEKLQKAEADKKAAERAARFPKKEERRPPPPPPPQKSASGTAAKPARPAPPPRPVKTEEPKKKGPGFIEGKHHHHIRTNCEACGKNSPDVEYYEHRNRALDKYWLCVRCADDNNILDEFRQTMQSSHAQKGFFQRGYGPTKIFKRKI
jgi:hypothetical protein